MTGTERSSIIAPMRRALVLVVSLAIGAAAQACEVSTHPARPQQPPPSTPAPAPGAQCVDGPAMCGADRASVVQCQRGMWVVLQPCAGARGCSIAGGAIQCDTSQSQAGAPCAPEGGYGCTPDQKNLTVCRGGRTAIASTCRGVRGCSAGNAVACDHSVALLGDPCDGPNEIACAQDGKALLRCTNGVYQFGEACRNACLSTSGRVLCQ